MKTERRHELQTNVLADSLGHWIKAIEPYSRAILAGCIAIVVALFAWLYISTQNSRQEAEGWNEYLEAIGNRDMQLLDEVAQRYSGTMVGQWARLTAADLELDSGTNRLMTDPAAARDQLRGAAEGYAALLLEPAQPTIEQRAAYGLARANEALGELEKARSEYRSLAEKWPDGPFAEAAQRRAADLDQKSTKQFYDWLASYEPPAPLSKEPGTPGARPDFLQEPDAGTLKLPSSLDDTKAPFPSLGGADAKDMVPASEPALPGIDTPAAEPAPQETPAEAAPTEDAPSADAASEAAPAEETPAEETPAEPAAAETPAETPQDKPGPELQ